MSATARSSAPDRLQGRAGSILAAAFLALLVAWPSAASAQYGARQLALDWLKSHRVELSAAPAGVAPLVRIGGAARVLGLGEAEHGYHEFYELRNRLVRELVERHGFTAIAAETGFTESTSVDDYIGGRGSLDSAVVGSVFAWSMSRPYAENRELIEWLREFNARASTKRKVHFYGLDLTGGRGGRFSETKLATEAIAAYLASVDSAAASGFARNLAPYAASLTSARYDSLNAGDQDAAANAIADLASLFERRQVTWSAHSSRVAYDRAYHTVFILRELVANFRAMHAESNPQAQREAAMAQSLAWVLEQEGPAGRVLLFQANWHISKGPMWSDRFDSSLGERLHAALGDDYVTIGTAYGAATGEGAPARPDTASFAALASTLGPGSFLIDLHGLPPHGGARAWFDVQRPVNGGRVDNMVLDRAFDALVYVDSIRPARPWAAAGQGL